MLRRFDILKNGMAILTGPMHRYLAQVLRKGPGDRIDLIDGKGYLYRCTIGSIKAKEIYVQVLDVVHHSSAPCRPRRMRS